MGLIYHVVEAQLWAEAQKLGQYRAATLDTEGFIHCSLKAQVAGVLERYYKNREGLVILEIDETKVTSPIRYEDSHGNGERFPHIYGPLNTSAVVRFSSSDAR